MLNLLDQLLGLTAKVLGYLLDWPFLLFVFLVWLASRYRDQIGSALDRRGAIKRSELASAIRDELEPITRDIGDLKPDVSQLRTKVAKIESLQSEYASERLLKPVNARVQSLEETVQEIQTRVSEVAGVDLRSEISERLAPVNKELELLRETLDRLAQEIQPFSEEVGKVKQSLEQISQRLDPVDRSMENLETALKRLESRVGEAPSAETVQQLHREVAQMGEELSGVTVSVALLKSRVEKYTDAEGSPSRSPGKQRNPNALKDAELIPLRVMKDALASTRWEWRRVKKLAGIAGLTEDRALEMLESDPDLEVKKDDWGRRIAKLLTK